MKIKALIVFIYGMVGVVSILLLSILIRFLDITRWGANWLFNRIENSTRK